MTVVIDTGALIWLLTGSRQLGDDAKSLMLRTPPALSDATPGCSVTS